MIFSLLFLQLLLYNVQGKHLLIETEDDTEGKHLLVETEDYTEKGSWEYYYLFI